MIIHATVGFNVRMYVSTDLELPDGSNQVDAEKAVETWAREQLERSYDLGNHGNHLATPYGIVGLSESVSPDAALWAQCDDKSIWPTTSGEFDLNFPDE